MENIELIIDHAGVALYWAVKIFAVTLASYFTIFALAGLKKWPLMAQIARIGAYPFAILNFVNNAYCMWILCLDPPREMATTLRMARYLLDYGEAESELNWRERWRLKVALFLCRLMAMADPDHCERQVRKMQRAAR